MSTANNIVNDDINIIRTHMLLILAYYINIIELHISI